MQQKAQKLALEAADKADRLELERERIAAQKEIAGLQVGAKIATDRNNLDAKQEEAGLRLGVEIARDTMSQAQPETPVSQNQQPKESK